jgi:hypothetical protein
MQDSNPQHNHAHNSRLELETQHTEFTTQMELKSLTQWRECAGAESGCFWILRECLVCSSMCLGIPFIAPRQLGVVGDQLGRPILPSVEWCTGQSGAPPDMSGAWFLSIRRAADRWSSGLVGAPDSPVCPTGRWHDLVSREDCVADRWRWRPLAHRTVRCATGQSGEF